MPLYEYQCTQCDKRTEVLQKFDDAPLAACPACGGEVKKMVSSPSFQFKGSGWYVTDYAGKKGGADGGGSSGKSEASGESKSDAAANSTATATPAGGSSESTKPAKESAPAKASSD